MYKIEKNQEKVNRLKQSLMALFTAFPAQDRDGTESELIAIYWIAIGDLPSGSVITAIEQFIRGQVPNHNGRFRPTPAELARLARRTPTNDPDEQKALQLQRHKQIGGPADHRKCGSLPTEKVRQKLIADPGLREQQISRTVAKALSVNAKIKSSVRNTQENENNKAAHLGDGDVEAGWLKMMGAEGEQA